MASEKTRDIEEILREIAEGHRQLQESHHKTEEGFLKLQESQLKTEEAQRKTEEAIRKTDGNFNNKWGSFMQSLVKGDFDKLLRSRGINVQQTSKGVEVKRSDGSIKWEFDLIAINGREVVLAEVKTTLSSHDVDAFLVKLADYKKCVESHRDKLLYGAVAYLDEAGAAKYAQKSGLFTIAAVGATEVATMTNPEGFVPKAF